MSLVFGVIVGLAYGLSSGADAFVALPLLVLAVSIPLHGALPAALAGWGLCAAIAAGDGARTRQCDPGLALWLAVGGMPVAIACACLAQGLAITMLVTIFALMSLVAVALSIWAAGNTDTERVAPAVLLHAPRRSLIEATAEHHYSWATRLLIVSAGALGGALATLCAAGMQTGSARALERVIPAQGMQIAGAGAMATAIVAVSAALPQFMMAPEVPGYMAGLYVLGTVAGMGFARRIAHEAAPAGLCAESICWPHCWPSRFGS